LFQSKLFTILLTASTLLANTGFALQKEALFPLSVTDLNNKEKISAGERLFHDPLFSQDATRSCASCHAIKSGGTDGLKQYKQYNQQPGALNTPTVLNASSHLKQFWNGRAKTLKHVIDDHILDKTIFANRWQTILKRLLASNHYVDLFDNIYADGITKHNVTDALTTYLNYLLTPNAPFDQYLKGDENALSNEAKKGYQLFKSYGCITCHQGPNLGGNLFARLGIYKDYFPKPPLHEEDLGHFNVTGKEEDRFVFKVPSLRNIALTAPYLHDGSAASLEEVIRIMGIYQVGQPIPEYEIAYLVAFLKSLTGSLPPSISNPAPKVDE